MLHVVQCSFVYMVILIVSWLLSKSRFDYFPKAMWFPVADKSKWLANVLLVSSYEIWLTKIMCTVPSWPLCKINMWMKSQYQSNSFKLHYIYFLFLNSLLGVFLSVLEFKLCHFFCFSLIILCLHFKHFCYAFHFSLLSLFFF